MQRKYSLLVILLTVVFAFSSCSDTRDLLNDTVDKLSSDGLKRTNIYLPNIVGEELEFVYAMAIPASYNAHLTSVEVTASIPGAAGTHFDNNSYGPNTSGADVPVEVCSPSVTSGATTSMQFVMDTIAAAFRFYYEIPEAARGKSVEFLFSAKSSDGQTTQYKLGPYQIENMDMKLDLVINNGEFLSIQNAAEPIVLPSNTTDWANADVMYAYSSNARLSHMFFTPTADAAILSAAGLTLPAGFVNQSQLIKEFQLRDRQLCRDVYSDNITDLDFTTLSYAEAVGHLSYMRQEGGFWIQTNNYWAFVYINRASANTLTISLKRLKR